MHSSWFPFEKHFIFSNWILSSNRATLTSYLHYNCHQEIVWMSFYWNLWMSIWFQFRFMDHYVFSYKCHNHNTTCPITSWYWMKMPISIIVCLKGILSTTHKYQNFQPNISRYIFRKSMSQENSLLLMDVSYIIYYTQYGTTCIIIYVSKYKRTFTNLIHSFQGFWTIMKVIFQLNPSSDLWARASSMGQWCKLLKFPMRSHLVQLFFIESIIK